MIVPQLKTFTPLMKTLLLNVKPTVLLLLMHKLHTLPLMRAMVHPMAMEQLNPAMKEKDKAEGRDAEVEEDFAAKHIK